ncbi:MAG: outer membrane protein assembly factor BamA [Verrucomicrobiota bacterium]
MKLKFRVLIWIIVLVSSGVFSSSGATIAEIAVENRGAGEIDRAFILSHVGSETGGELDRFRISRDVKSLLETGRFTHVNVRVKSLGSETVRLIYSAKNRLKLAARAEVEGGDHFDAARVREIMDLWPGDLIDDQTVGLAVQRLKEKYAEDYYTDVRIDWQIDMIDQGKRLAGLSIRIDEGEPKPVDRVIFQGNKHLSYNQLRKPFEQPAWYNPFKWFRKKRFDPDELETARLVIEQMYAFEGYLRAEVQMPERKIDSDGRVVIEVEIDEGDRYRIGQVGIDGVELFPEQALLGRVGIKTGEVASLYAIRQSAAAIGDFYGKRGYVDTIVRPATEPGEAANTVDVVFDVREGEKVWIHDVDISGNSKTRDKVIRRELLVYPGDLYDEVAIERSEKRLMNLGFFSSVRSYPEKTREDKKRNVIFEVEEKPTGQFMVGAGFSSIENLIGFVQVQQGNFDLTGWPYFTGGGQKLKLSAEFGSTTESYELSFVEPWFMDRKLSLGVDLYNKTLSYDDYDLEQTGGAVSLRKGLAGPNSIQARYRLEKTFVSDVTDTNEYFYVEQDSEGYFFTREKDVLQSSLRLSLIHDTRNSPFVPTKGTRAVAFAEITGGILGFDTDIYEVGLRVNNYIPVWLDHVVSLSARAEVVEAYGETDEVTISDRLFLGGGRTIRGFEYRDVGPKVVREEDLGIDGDVPHRTVGGNSLALASAEYWVPVLPNIRLASFVDVGNVWRDSYEFRLEELAATYGAGVRLDVPGFPIRIDWAWPLWRDDDLTDTERFVFWIGYER